MVVGVEGRNHIFKLQRQTYLRQGGETHGDEDLVKSKEESSKIFTDRRLPWLILQGNGDSIRQNSEGLVSRQVLP